MQTTTLRRVGGSVMMAVPPAVLEQLDLGVWSLVSTEVSEGQLIVKPRKLKYTLEELLAQCDPNAPVSDEEREWLKAPAVGRELI